MEKKISWKRNCLKWTTALSLVLLQVPTGAYGMMQQDFQQPENGKTPSIIRENSPHQMIGEDAAHQSQPSCYESPLPYPQNNLCSNEDGSQDHTRSRKEDRKFQNSLKPINVPKGARAKINQAPISLWGSQPSQGKNSNTTLVHQQLQPEASFSRKRFEGTASTSSSSHKGIPAHLDKSLLEKSTNNIKREDPWSSNREYAIKNRIKFIQSLNNTLYNKGSSPFFDNFHDNNPNKCYFYKNGKASGNETYTRHHVIGADGYLREVWNDFIGYEHHSDKSLSTFFDYIELARQYLGNGANAMDPMDKSDLESFREMVIWNPGNIVLGPAPEDRAEMQKNLFYTSDYPDLEDAILAQLHNNTKTDFLYAQAQNTVNLVREIRDHLNPITSYLSKEKKENISYAFTKFWKHWAQVFNSGYIIYNWTTDKKNNLYSPSNYVKSFSNRKTGGF